MALNLDFKEKAAPFFKQVYKEILIQDNNTCQQCPVIVLPFVVLLGNNFPAGEAPAGTSCFAICDWICPLEGLPLCTGVLPAGHPTPLLKKDITVRVPAAQLPPAPPLSLPLFVTKMQFV